MSRGCSTRPSSTWAYLKVLCVSAVISTLPSSRSETVITRNVCASTVAVLNIHCAPDCGAAASAVVSVMVLPVMPVTADVPTVPSGSMA